LGHIPYEREADAMARISLKCPCGWSFFVPGSTPSHEAACPNCGAAVAIPGRSPSGRPPLSPGELAAELQARQKRTLLFIGLGAAVVIGIVLVLVLGSGSPPSEDPPARPPRPLVEKPQPLSQPRPAAAPGAAAQPGSSAPRVSLPFNREGRVGELRRGIRSASALLGLAAVSATSLRLRGHANEAAQLETRMTGWEVEITKAMTELGELEDRFVPDPYARVGDRLVGFSLRDLTPMKPSEVDQQVLSPWLRGLRTGQPVEQAVFLRGSERVEIYLQFAEVTEVMQGVARLPDITGPGTYNDPPPPPPPLTPAAGFLTGGIPDVLSKDIQDRFAALPAGYKESLPAPDRARLDALLAAKTGTQDDLRFLSLRIQAEILPAFEREARAVRSRAVELEPKLKQTTAVDLIYFKGGRTLAAQVVAETDETVKIKNGPTAWTEPRENIARIEKGKGPGPAFAGKLAACPRTVADLSKLLTWCQDGTLRMEAEYVGLLIMALDPRPDGPRKAAQLPPKPPLK
jgi:hypothetical protein